MKGFSVLILTVALFLLAATSVSAQSGEIAQFLLIKPKSGMERQFEDAVKQHMAWHRQQNDTWEWLVFQYETGAQLGQFVALTPDHRWEDFDAKSAFRKEDRADAMVKIGPYMESLVGWYSRVHTDISNLPDGEFPLVQVISFHLRPGKAIDFLEVTRKFHDVLKKANWPFSYLWEELLTGEQLPMFNLVILHKNWAGFNPPPKPLPVVLEEILGRRETDALFKALYECIESQRTEILRYRPDLSYVPAGQ